jgi:threonylcarbamoyladenosine tRNA methylthiotransferase MtaB
MVSKARKENPSAKIILTGCWPKVYDIKAEDLGVDYVFRAWEEDELVEKISKLQFLISNKIPNSKFQIPKNCVIKHNLIDKSRYFIKIQDGCEQYCTYCVIPYARGKLKSRPEKEILEEIRKAVASGFREVVLSGVHIGLYGKDKKVESLKFKVKSKDIKNINLVGLIKKIIKIKGLGRVRISSIEITEVSDELIGLIASTGKICNHLHISLQSGCDKILKLMNRPYTAKYFEDRVKKIRKAIPDIAITTDVIVGFPGETKTDFKKTYNFCKKINFSKIHVFSFSAHEKAPASKMKNKVSKEEIAERSKKLRALSQKLEKKYKNKFQGRELSVVVEGKTKSGLIKGKSEFYFDVLFDEPRLKRYNNIKYSNRLIGKIITIINLV